MAEMSACLENSGALRVVVGREVVDDSIIIYYWM
jgi:hypothetical protein